MCVRACVRVCVRVFVRVPVRAWCVVCVVSFFYLSLMIAGMCVVDGTTNE